MQLNVNVSPESHRGAKAASEKAGMLLRKWIERAITRQAEEELGNVGVAPRKERYVDVSID